MHGTYFKLLKLTFTENHKFPEFLTIAGKQFYPTTDSLGSYICEIIVTHAYVAYCTEPCPFRV
jgi:hypothetical protein